MSREPDFSTRLDASRSRKRWETRLVAVGAAFFIALGFTEGSSENGLTGDIPLWALFLSGAIAICAMILPGISGSFLLEYNFRVPGMGKMLLDAITNKDFPIIQCFTAILAGVFILLSIYGDFYCRS